MRTSVEGDSPAAGGGAPSIVNLVADPPAPNGTTLTALAERTPGMARTRSSARRKKATRSASSGYLGLGNCIRNVRTFSARNPGSTDRSRTRLSRNRLEPTSSTSARAICMTTNSPRAPPVRAPALDREPLSLSAVLTSVRELWNAGTMPNTTLVASATTAVKASTRASSVT